MPKKPENLDLYDEHEEVVSKGGKKVRRRGIFLLPNLLTTASLFAGFFSIISSTEGNFVYAGMAVFIAQIFDGLDGRVARLAKAESQFGAQYDSLSDVISFGVAPGILIYLWSTFELSSLGWSISLFFVICSALRLARFTADIYIAPKNIDSKVYFVGVPSPGAAGLCLLPVFIVFEFDFLFFKNPYLNIINLLIIGLMMISKIPTFSVKSINFNRKYSAWIILAIAIICISLLSNLWLTLILLLITYIVSIVYTVLKKI